MPKTIDLTRKEMKKFVSYYLSHECLWNSTSDSYKNRNLRRAAFKSIALAMSTVASLPEDMAIMTTEHISTKINNIRSYFSKELRKVNESMNSGDNGEVYVPKWEFYSALEPFLRSQMEQRQSASNNLVKNSTDDIKHSRTSSPDYEHSRVSSPEVKHSIISSPYVEHSRTSSPDVDLLVVNGSDESDVEDSFLSKRKKINGENFKEITSTALQRLTDKQLHPDIALGKYVGIKLKYCQDKVKKKQAIMAIYAALLELE
ncbi:Uncharacterised protein g6920 [Pycnogonum litorale]